MKRFILALALIVASMTSARAVQCFDSLATARAALGPAAHIAWQGRKGHEEYFKGRKGPHVKCDSQETVKHAQKTIKPDIPVKAVKTPLIWFAQYDELFQKQHATLMPAMTEPVPQAKPPGVTEPVPQAKPPGMPLWEAWSILIVMGAITALGSLLAHSLWHADNPLAWKSPLRFC